MMIRIALQVFDGPETDDLPHDTGEELRQIETQRVLDFEVVNGSGWRIDAESDYWYKHREAILDAIEERAMTLRRENYILPLCNEVFRWRPSSGLNLEYRIKCLRCKDGMSERSDSGQCEKCDEDLAKLIKVISATAVHNSK